MTTPFDYRRAAACEFDTHLPPPKSYLGLLDRATYEIARMLCALLLGLVGGACVFGVTQAVAAPVPAPLVAEQQLSDIASAYAGRPVTVACQASEAAWVADPNSMEGHADGYAWLQGEAVLSPDVCQGLAPVLRGGRVRSYAESGAAVLVFVHEATHIALQTADEGLTECTASRNVWSVLPLFGALGARRNRLEVGAQSNHARMPADYRTVC